MVVDESTSVALTIASQEYQRRVQQAQAASARVDQTPTILGTGLTLLLSALVAVYAATWPADRSRFWLAAAAVCAMSSVFTVLVIYRDFVARSSLTEAEKAQTRLRHYFVSQAPEVQPYLSDTIYDDWPTPFTNPRGSKTFAAWLVLVVLASMFLGTATAAAVHGLYQANAVVTFTVSIAAAAATCAGLAAVLMRLARRQAGLDRPRYPTPRPIHDDDQGIRSS